MFANYYILLVSENSEYAAMSGREHLDSEQKIQIKFKINETATLICPEVNNVEWKYGNSNITDLKLMVRIFQKINDCLEYLFSMQCFLL